MLYVKVINKEREREREHNKKSDHVQYLPELQWLWTSYYSINRDMIGEVDNRIAYYTIMVSTGTTCHETMYTIIIVT